MRREGLVAPAATTATAAATTATTAATATAATTTATLVGFVDPNGAPVEFRSVELCDGLIRGRIVVERHEAEASRATGVPVKDDFRLGDIAKGCERSVERVVVGSPSQATNKELLAHTLLSLKHMWPQSTTVGKACPTQLDHQGR